MVVFVCTVQSSKLAANQYTLHYLQPAQVNSTEVEDFGDTPSQVQ